MPSAEIAQRLFVESDLATGGTLTLGDGQAHYLVNVMRLKAGDMVAVFNGRDGEWAATIAETGKKRCTLRLEGRLRAQAREPDVWLVFAPLKKARIDLVAEKATELGVRVLQPVMTQHTNAERVNVERLHAIAVEAAEQCGRLAVPEVKTPQALIKIVAEWPADRRMFVLDEHGGGTPIADALQKHKSGPCGFLVGPEGGFSADEIAALKRAPFVTTVALGARILRAETASLAALACWQAISGDWR